MDQYINRLVTFTSWPNHVTVSVIALADAGFYYRNHRDEVECFNCNVRIASWANDDNPLIKHLHYSPMCSYAVAKYSRLQTERENIPKSSRNSLISNTFKKESSPVNITSNKDVLDLFKNVNSHVNMEAPNYLERRNVQNIDRTEIDYTVEMNRLTSFTSHWPDDSAVSIADLVAAGMYYTGPGDRVQCAWCRGGLYNWEDGDTALGEHKKHFPQCPFIQSKFPESGQPNISNKHEDELGKGMTMKENEVTLPSPPNTATSEWKRFEDEEKKETENDWHSYPSVKIMEQMGYGTDIVKEAAEMVMQKSGNFTTDEMMDAIFELESKQDEEDEDKMMGNENVRNDFQLEGAVGYSHNKSMEKYHDDISKVKDIPTTTTTGDSNTDKKCDNPSNNNNDSQSIIKGSEGAELLHLKEENSLLKSTTICKICLDKTVNILFLPCRHLVCCEECGEAVKQCPLCRTVIIGTIRTFLS